MGGREKGGPRGVCLLASVWFFIPLQMGSWSTMDLSRDALSKMLKIDLCNFCNWLNTPVPPVYLGVSFFDINKSLFLIKKKVENWLHSYILDSIGCLCNKCHFSREISRIKDMFTECFHSKLFLAGSYFSWNWWSLIHCTYRRSIIELGLIDCT